MTILAGDIGGTNTRLALYEPRGGALRRAASHTFASLDYASLDDIVREFMAANPSRLAAASLAIAGPVRDGRVATTNLAWLVDGAALAAQLGLVRVTLLNDLEAIAHGVARLPASSLLTLNAGAPPAHGNRAVIAAGTGLGEAGIFWDGRAWHPFATEGGHADFAPRNARESALLEYLRRKHERVSCERVLSGSGLVEVWRFLQESGEGAEDPADTERMLQQGHPAPIVRAALEGRSERCAAALELFVSLYGAEAGNLALKLMARGGVYVAGGIAPRILERLKAGGFMAAFLAKGRMRPLLESMPVHVVLDDEVGLLGAASCASNSGSGY